MVDYLALHRRDNWISGSVAGNGVIIGIPANADSVLLIDPGKVPKISQVGNADIIQTGRHRKDGKYKFLGAMVGNDGHVYCIPSGSERVLQVDTVRSKVRSIGPNVIDASLEAMHPNKWQNGFTAPDGSMYAIPLNAETVLRVQVVPKQGEDGYVDDEDVIVTTFGGPFKGMNKWEGGVMLEDGTMYCMPNDFKAVLKIEPTRSEPVTVVSDRDENESEASLKKLFDSQVSVCEASRNLDIVTDSNPTTSPHVDFSTTPNNRLAEADSSPSEYQQQRDMMYKFNIPTLRSATHRVRYSTKKASQNTAEPKGQERNRKQSNPANKVSNGTNVYLLPPELRKESKLVFDTETHDIRVAVIALLQSADSSLIGYWANHHGENEQTQRMGNRTWSLEDFVVPPPSLSRAAYGGACESAQQYLSDHILSNDRFLDVFDQLVTECILPNLKQRLRTIGAVNETKNGGKVTFYYQRPPTLRLQPGPSQSYVKPHADSEYGHQDGEINYWLPLTDPTLTQTELWCESEPGLEDYHPLHCTYGEICSFFGSYCRHYVPANKSRYTRISLDFRVGIEGLGFEIDWQMIGTKNDHARRQVIL